MDPRSRPDTAQLLNLEYIMLERAWVEFRQAGKEHQDLKTKVQLLREHLKVQRECYRERYAREALELEQCMHEQAEAGKAELIKQLGIAIENVGRRYLQDDHDPEGIKNIEHAKVRMAQWCGQATRDLHQSAHDALLEQAEAGKAELIKQLDSAIDECAESPSLHLQDDHDPEGSRIIEHAKVRMAQWYGRATRDLHQFAHDKVEAAKAEIVKQLDNLFDECFDILRRNLRGPERSGGVDFWHANYSIPPPPPQPRVPSLSLS